MSLCLVPSAKLGTFFSIKGQLVNILGFAGHAVSVATTHFVVIVQKPPQTNEPGYVSIKVYL